MTVIAILKASSVEKCIDVTSNVTAGGALSRSHIVLPSQYS